MAKKYTKSKLKVFKESIEKRMEEIATDTDDLHDGILDNSNNGGNLSQESVFSVHMAYAGTDSFEKEKNYNLMSRESDYYKNLEIALERIDDGTDNWIKFRLESFIGGDEEPYEPRPTKSKLPVGTHHPRPHQI